MGEGIAMLPCTSLFSSSVTRLDRVNSQCSEYSYSRYSSSAVRRSRLSQKEMEWEVLA